MSRAMAAGPGDAGGDRTGLLTTTKEAAMRRSRNRRGIGLGFVSSALAALFVVVPLPAAGAPVAAAAPGLTGPQRVGGEVLVNERTARFQRQPDVSAASDGRMLVVWQDGNPPSRGCIRPARWCRAAMSMRGAGRRAASRMLMGKASDQGINLFQNPQVAASPFFPSIFLTTAFYWSDPGTPIMGQLSSSPKRPPPSRRCNRLRSAPSRPRATSPCCPAATTRWRRRTATSSST